jgi:hypothetical protein
LSVLNIMFESTGSVVLRLATARLTTLTPLERFSCKQETFIPGPPAWEKSRPLKVSAELQWGIGNRLVEI